LLELVIAMAILVVGFLTVMTCFAVSYRHAVLSLDRELVYALSQDLLQQVKAHPYGAPQPLDWSRPRRIDVLSEGRPVQVVLQPTVTAKTGALFGKTSEPTDEIQILIQWSEAGALKSFTLVTTVQRAQRP
jgi:hypothetical protein